MESISGLDAFRPRYTVPVNETMTTNQDLPESSSSHSSDYQEPSGLDPDYVPIPDDSDIENL